MGMMWEDRGLVKNLDSSCWDFLSLCVFTGENMHTKNKKQACKERMCRVSDVHNSRTLGFSLTVRGVTFFKESSCLLVCSSTVMCRLTVNNKCNIGLSAARAISSFQSVCTQQTRSLVPGLITRQKSHYHPSI